MAALWLVPCEFLTKLEDYLELPSKQVTTSNKPFVNHAHMLSIKEVMS